MADESVSEEWRPVQGWPDYEISSLGRVRRATDAYWGKWQARHIRVPAGYILGTRFNAFGYPSVLFRVGEPAARKFKNFLVHILVCEAFIGPRPSPKHQVAHWDGDRANCRLDNLRWATHAENMRDMVRHGRTARGINHRDVKLTEEQVREIRQLLAHGLSFRKIAPLFGVGKTTIEQIKTGRAWSWLV